jgi:hypothetical protein
VLRTACALLLALASPAAGQATGPNGAPAAPSLPAALRADVDRLADSARALGVPAEPLYLKAAEGVLKHAPDDRVAAAVGRLLGELVEARRALGPRAEGDELVAAASVLHAGLEPAALRRIRASRGSRADGGSLLMPLVVLADLVARRVSPELATSSVALLVERGAPDEELASLRSRVERDVVRGQRPDDAFRSALRLGPLPP